MFTRHKYDIVFLQRNVPCHIAIGKRTSAVSHQDVRLCKVAASNHPNFLHQRRFLIHVCSGNGLQDRHLSWHGNHPRFLYIAKYEDPLDLQHLLLQQDLHTRLAHIRLRSLLNTGFCYSSGDSSDVHLYKPGRNLSILSYDTGELLLAGTASNHYLKRIASLDWSFRGRDCFIGIDISLRQLWDRDTWWADRRRWQR